MTRANLVLHSEEPRDTNKVAPVKADGVPASEPTTESKETDKSTKKKTEVVDEAILKASPGSISNVRNIYRDPKNTDDTYTWLEDCPEDVPDAAENEVTAKYAIIVRNVKSNDSRKRFEAHSIIIQSPWLQKVLGDHVLKDYPGVTCELKRLEFNAPFAPFVHRWKEFLKVKDRNDLDQVAKEHLNLLYDILKREIGDAIQAQEDHIKNGVVTFKHLWMIFQPGSVVISDTRGARSAFELDRAEYVDTNCGKVLRLHCETVDWDGKAFGRGDESIDIREFHGTRKIHTLHTCPFNYYDGKERVKEELIDRGKKFEALAGHHFKQ